MNIEGCSLTLQGEHTVQTVDDIAFSAILNVPGEQGIGTSLQLGQLLYNKLNTSVARTHSDKSGIT